MKAKIMLMMLPVALPLALPASAAVCGEPAIQEVWRIDGSWQGTDGPLVSVSPGGASLAWQTLEGVTLTAVQAESFPEQVDGAVISAAVMLPGAPSGSIPITGDVDHRVVFSGTAECTTELAPQVHEDPVEAFEAPVPVEVAPAVAAAPIDTRPDSAPRYRRLIGRVFAE